MKRFKTNSEATQRALGDHKYQDSPNVLSIFKTFDPTGHHKNGYLGILKSDEISGSFGSMNLQNCIFSRGLHGKLIFADAQYLYFVH